MSKRIHSTLASRAARALSASVAALVIAATFSVASTPSAGASVFAGSGFATNTVLCNSSKHTVTVNTNITPQIDYYANTLNTWLKIHIYSAQTRTWFVNTDWLPGNYSRTASASLPAGTYYVYFDYAFQTQSGIVYSHEWAGDGGYPGTYANQYGYGALSACVL